LILEKNMLRIARWQGKKQEQLEVT
jgi:hypothetical protein